MIIIYMLLSNNVNCAILDIEKGGKPMKHKSRFVALSSLLLTAVLIMPMTGPVGASTIIDTFGDGSSDNTITFNGPGEDTSLYLTVPKMSVVNLATMTIEGDSLRAANPLTLDYDYNDTTNNAGWTGTTTSNVSSTLNGPGSFQANGIAQGDYTSLQQSDDFWLETMSKGAAYDYHQFKFTVNMAEISKIDVEWEGNAEWIDITGASGKTMKGAHVYIWNNGSAIWEKVGSYELDSGRVDERIQNTFSGSLDGYLYNDVEIRVIVQNYHGDGGIGGTTVATDFVKITVTGKPLEWPSDVALDVGDDGTDDWTYAGALMSEESFGGVEFVDALQDVIDAEGVGHGSFDITLSFSSATGGKMYVGGLSINLDGYTNEPPALTDIPNNLHFDEDTDAPGLIDLKAYFEDDIDPDADLVFALENESDPDLIHAEVTTAGMVDFTTPTDNWFGTASFTVSATDTDTAKTASNEFTVTVDPVDDPPELTAVGPQTFAENEQSSIILTASDPDKLFGGSDTMSFSAIFLTGKTLFTLNPGTGAAHFIPTDADVGEYSVEFTVTDKTSLYDSEIVKITITDVNNPPELDHIGKQVLDEDEPFELQLTASDIDVADGNGLTFSVEFVDGPELFTVETDGHISFTPVQEDVGSHKAKLTVTDPAGGTDTEEVLFEVRNVNDPPVITPITSQTVNRNTAFSIQVVATDEDIGYANTEYLEFSDNTKLFDIDPDSGWMNFTASTDQVDTYSVTITVKDLLDATATMTFSIEVILNNSAPEAKIITPDNKTSFPEGRVLELEAEASDDDDDPMTYKWVRKTKKKDIELGTEETVSLKGLSAGKHTIVLEVNDGIETTKVEKDITIKASGSGTPGFEAGFMLLAMVLTGLIVALRRRA